MDYKEEQEEEREVLLSIYEEDERFKQINDTTFQYKFGEDGHFKSFVLEISWPENYPEIAPNINLNAFYNKHLCDQVKQDIGLKLMEQSEANMGCAVTYTLFDWTNEHLEDLTAEQQEFQLSAASPSPVKSTEDNQDNEKTSKKEKKERLTKTQKRKIGNRLNEKGELERGWNWADIIRHLSKTAPS